MISSFKSRALRRFWTKNDKGAVSADWRDKIDLLLNTLDSATKPEQMNFPGSGFHSLTGNQRGRYALTVSRNWRITFAWKGEDAIDVDLEDYHGR
jgi:toxin HigB-1